MNPFKLAGWDKATGILHFALAFLVTCQLFIALNMKHYHLFPWHKATGFCIGAVILLHWLYIYHTRNWQHFFPFSSHGLKNVWSDLMLLPQGKLPHGSQQRLGLPGLIHGFGLLTVTAMAVTGITMYLLFKFGLPNHFIKLSHKFFAELLWIYWFGHGGMALLHMVLERRKAA